MKACIVKTTTWFLIFSLLIPLCTVLSFAEPDDAEAAVTNQEAVEAARNYVFYTWLLGGYYDDFCRTDEEWAVERGAFSCPESCDLYRNWLIEKGYAVKGRSAHRSFDVTDETGSVAKTLELHAFPAGVTMSKIREDQMRYSPAMERYYNCSCLHKTTEPCCNEYLFEYDGALYGKIITRAGRGSGGPYSTDITRPECTAKDGAVIVRFTGFDLLNVEKAGDGLLVSDLQAPTATLFTREHLAYDPQFDDLLNVAKIGAFLISYSYSGFPETGGLPEGSEPDTELAALYDFAQKNGLTTDRARALSSLNGGSDGINDHTYPLTGIKSEKDFRALAEKYIAKGYVDQVFKKGFLTEREGEVWSKEAEAGTLTQFLFDMMYVKEYDGDRAVVTIGSTWEEASLLMKKDGNRWKVIGGTFASEFFMESPQTGERTGTYAMIALTAVLLCSAALTVLKKKKARV